MTQCGHSDSANPYNTTLKGLNRFSGDLGAEHSEVMRPRIGVSE
jgi:hypothetical protein